MSIDEAVRTRIVQLLDRAGNLRSPRSHAGAIPAVDLAHMCTAWLTSASHVIRIVVPNPLSAHREAAERAQMCSTMQARVVAMAAVLYSLLEDVDAGLVTSIANAARGEIFDDFLDHAEHYLRGKKVAQAGVIAGVVFEDTVRKACQKNNITQAGQKLDQLISELEKKELLTGVKAKRARAAAAVRTSATHAQWDEFERSDVEATIKTTRELVEQLLL